MPRRSVDRSAHPLVLHILIELEREDDGRWLAEVPDLPGVMCYGIDRDEAVARVQALALRVIEPDQAHLLRCAV